MVKKEWLKTLGVGDKVAIEGRLTDVRIVEIERITKLYFIIKEEKFRRIDGYKIGGDGWNFISIQQITDEIKAKILARHLEVKIHNGGLRKLSLTKLKNIEQIVISKFHNNQQTKGE